MYYTFHANCKLSSNMLFYLDKSRNRIYLKDVCVMHIAIDKLFEMWLQLKGSELLMLVGAGEFLKGKILPVVFCNRY